MKLTNKTSKENEMITLLFQSTFIAKEIAFSLRGIWDGFNAVSLDENIIPDLANALELAGEASNAYCFQGAVGYIDIDQAKDISIRRKLYFLLTGFRQFDIITTMNVDNGFQLILEQGLLKPNKELTNKFETFFYYLQVGFSKIEASQKAKLSWSVVIFLEDLGKVLPLY